MFLRHAMRSNEAKILLFVKLFYTKLHSMWTWNWNYERSKEVTRSVSVSKEQIFMQARNRKECVSSWILFTAFVFVGSVRHGNVSTICKLLQSMEASAWSSNFNIWKRLNWVVNEFYVNSVCSAPAHYSVICVLIKCSTHAHEINND